MLTDIVCPFCGTLCDDIEADVEDNRIKNVRHACKIGTAKFLSVLEGDRPVKPLIRKNGEFVESSIETAVKKTAEILTKSKKPLLYGWSSTSCDAHSFGIAIAEKVGGVIDSTSSVCHGPSVLAVHDVGLPSLTLSEVKNRADLVIYWGCNPMHAHPRHLSRYTIYPRGYFRERGHQDRELVVVDVRKTDTSKIANKFIQVEYGKDYELLGALRAVVNGNEIDIEEVGGVKKEDIYELAEKMENCQFGVIFFGMGLTMTSGKHRNVDNAISLTKDLNRHTKFSIMPMRGHYNVTGFSEVLTWQTGYPYAVDFSTGYPRYNPGETTANDILQRGEADAALIVASDPVAHFPRKSVEHLAKMPLVYIGPHFTLTTEFADVFIPSTFVGIETEGIAYRMDTIPLNMRKVVNPPDGVLSDEEILERILKEIERSE
ncbi:MAG: formylmethanofuran dehydrogenase subunit B [Candidatus Hydrothermarchaeaceae archaeon]